MSKPLAVFSILGLAAILFLAPFVFASGMRLEADLMGEEIDGIFPEGNAEWRMESDGFSRIKVDVDEVNLPDGEMLMVSACGMEDIGMIEIMGMEGDLDLREKNGDMAPVCEAGDMVEVMHNGSTVLFGTFEEEGLNEVVD